MKLSRRIEEAKVDHAESLLRELLTDGPMRPKNVRAVAAERGFVPNDDTWAAARRRLGVRSTDLGAGVWAWTLPGPTFEESVSSWLDSPHGRFARFTAERQRLGPEPIEEQGGQLALVMD